MISAKLHLPYRFLKQLTLQRQGSKLIDKTVKKALCMFTLKRSFKTPTKSRITLFTLEITLIPMEISFSVDSNLRN